MNLSFKSRLVAFSWHLLFSALAAIFSSIMVFFVWYPGPLAQASGVRDIFILLLFVDVIIGPFITLIIFNRAKKELKRDLVVVAAMQLAAMLYGLHAVFIARPVYIAYTLDRFEIVYAVDVSAENLARAVRPEYKSLPMTGPKIIAAPLPEDAKSREDIVMNAVIGDGTDVQQMPEYYRPYPEQMVTVLKNIKPLENLKSIDVDRIRDVSALISKYANMHRSVGYIGIKGKVSNLAAIVDKATGEVLEISDLSS